MREILFRGKMKTGDWVQGSYVYAHKWFGTGEAGHFITSIYGDNRVSVNPETVGEYTGLCDKNGNKIFEGDIVLNREKEKCVVKYGRHDLVCCGCCYESHESVGFYLGYEDDFAFSDDNAWKNIEVIGNIHDNPELLEVE